MEAFAVPAQTLESTPEKTSPNISLLMRAADGEVYFISAETLKQCRLTNPEEVIENLDLDSIGMPPREYAPEEIAEAMSHIDFSKALISPERLQSVDLVSDRPAMVMINLIVWKPENTEDREQSS